jgi:hypothetical protein
MTAEHTADEQAQAPPFEVKGLSHQLHPSLGELESHGLQRPGAWLRCIIREPNCT